MGRRSPHARLWIYLCLSVVLPTGIACTDATYSRGSATATKNDSGAAGSRLNPTGTASDANDDTASITGDAGSVGVGGASASGGAGGGNAATFVKIAPYDFESGTQAWAPSNGEPGTVASSPDAHASGDRALSIAVSSTAPTSYSVAVSPPMPGIPPGARVTFNLLLPPGALVEWVEVYAQEDAGSGYRFTTKHLAASTVSFGFWTTVTLGIPADSSAIASIGFRFHTADAWTGSVYLDAISW